jgi:hypothetical protein
MEELLILLVQFVIELIGDVLCSGLFDLPLPEQSRNTRAARLVVYASWLLGGAAVAGLSLLVFDHSLIARPGWRIANLLAAPYCSALVAEFMAKRRQMAGRDTDPGHHFWRSLWFTLGLVAVRFAYVSRL